ncbi:capsular polysaccharide export protein, LipB/KpsS family [Oryzibacter oryziterrae]|uniref:capsular polysaccharide export protein, LipB/KpsS family n=1 Tax=Oryzibacter oryziterrae TaxID=2766474 RepID=UPI001F30A1A1|nr:capsular polysaccharide biosynthesis protein [Oryzibacter oryziterrae]
MTDILPDAKDPFVNATVFTLRVNQWKRPIFEAYFPTARFVHLPSGITGQMFTRDWASRIEAVQDAVLLHWGARVDGDIEAFATLHGIPLWRIEDGFIRSLVGRASRTPPLSLTIDSGTAYYDARRPSDLEVLLNNFECSPGLLKRARAGIDRLLAAGITKYNGSASSTGLPPRDGRRRILVLGQVEEDQSIEFGCARPWVNNDLVRLAASDHPEAEIIYRPHPDVLGGMRRPGSNPDEVADIAYVYTAAVPLPTLLDEVDAVYTITSLGGFEALLRGLPVTVTGSPFYSGWGLTDDRQSNPRRKRRRTVEELFAIAYIVYPHYFDASTGDRIDFERCLNLVETWRCGSVPAKATDIDLWRKPVQWRWFGPYGVLGWRHLLTPIVAPIVRHIGGVEAASAFRNNPIDFFRDVSGPNFRLYRWIGRILYPFG